MYLIALLKIVITLCLSVLYICVIFILFFFFFLIIRRPPRSTRTDHSSPTRRSSDLFRSVPAPRFWQALVILLVEQGHPCGSERAVGRLDSHRQPGPAITGFQQAHQGADQPKQGTEQAALGAVGRVMGLQVISQLGTMVGAGHRGDRGHQLRTLGRRITCREGALAVADQVDLLCTGLLEYLLDPRQQLLATYLR